jgi:hypothetical protein
MESIDSKVPYRVSIGSEHWDIPMRVELRPYLEFNRRIACQLRELVNRWPGHTPQNLPNRFRNRRNTKK